MHLILNARVFALCHHRSADGKQTLLSVLALEVMRVESGAAGAAGAGEGGGDGEGGGGAEVPLLSEEMACLNHSMLKVGGFVSVLSPTAARLQDRSGE